PPTLLYLLPLYRLSRSLSLLKLSASDSYFSTSLSPLLSLSILPLSDISPLIVPSINSTASFASRISFLQHFCTLLSLRTTPATSLTPHPSAHFYHLLP